MNDEQLHQLVALICKELRLADRQSSEVFTTVEAAEYLRVSRQFLEIARVKGGGPPYAKLSRAVRYRRVDLDEWLARRVRQSTAQEVSI